MIRPIFNCVLSGICLMSSWASVKIPKNYDTINMGMVNKCYTLHVLDITTNKVQNFSLEKKTLAKVIHDGEEDKLKVRINNSMNLNPKNLVRENEILLFKKHKCVGDKK